MEKTGDLREAPPALPDDSRQFLKFYETGLEGYTYLEEP
jgi:hypothetical protein